MIVYLASPRSQLQAHSVSGMDVLISYATFSPWHTQYIPTFRSLLIDSGAYSAYNSGKTISVEAYADWSSQWEGRAVAIAGLDDIKGDWKTSLKNYELCGFPTYHNSDPPELLDDLIEIAKRRGNWLGIGIDGKREGMEGFLKGTMERIPPEIHVHGWALRRYRWMYRFGSVDSTNWWRQGIEFRLQLPWLSYAECLEIVVKRESREVIKPPDKDDKTQGKLFS